MRNRLSTLILLSLLATSILGGCGPATAEPTPRPTEPPAEEVLPVPSPEVARDTVLAFLADTYAEAVPVPGLLWTEENTTPEGLVGSTSLEYKAETWIVSVSFPVVAPEATVYRIVVANRDTGYRWEGDVDARGQVTERVVGMPPAKVTEVPVGQDQPGMPVEITAVDLAELAEGNAAFAFDLLRVLRAEEGNLFYSPYSISMALAMTYAGARGETEQQMGGVLHFPLSQERLHPAFEQLARDLESRGEGAEGKDGQGFRLNIANAIWGQEGYQFLTGFLDILSANYGAGLKPADFVGQPEAARRLINDWASTETEGKIQDLLPPGVINALTRLVLTNAIYFNAAWDRPFEPELTRDGAFHLLDGSSVSLPMMRQEGSYAYGEGDGYEAAELLYDGGGISMLILLPTQGEFQSFETRLDADLVATTLQDVHYRQVALTLPRFEVESRFSLVETLSALGMSVAFGSDADFSGMTGNRELAISEVIHKAFVSVDEAGTEAAAATAVEMALTAAPEPPVEFVVDRPFLFLIRDTGTGTILFVGRVLNPAA